MLNLLLYLQKPPQQQYQNVGETNCSFEIDNFPIINCQPGLVFLFQACHEKSMHVAKLNFSLIYKCQL